LLRRFLRVFQWISGSCPVFVSLEYQLYASSGKTLRQRKQRYAPGGGADSHRRFVPSRQEP
jgi:hypothetical protein